MQKKSFYILVFIVAATIGILILNKLWFTNPVKQTIRPTEDNIEEQSYVKTSNSVPSKNIPDSIFPKQQPVLQTIEAVTQNVSVSESPNVNTDAFDDEVQDWLEALDEKERNKYIMYFNKGWFLPEDVPIIYQEPSDGDNVGVWMWEEDSLGVDNLLPMPPDVEEENRRLTKGLRESMDDGDSESMEQLHDKICAISIPYWQKHKVQVASYRNVPEDWMPYFQAKFEKYTEDVDGRQTFR